MTMFSDLMAAATVNMPAIVLSGGSAFGLDAPSGVQAWLRERERGFRIAPGLPPVPIVSGAFHVMSEPLPTIEPPEAFHEYESVLLSLSAAVQ